MIGLILLSLGVTSIISFLISLGFYFITPSLAYAIFWISFGLQWVIMEPVNRLLRTRTIKEEGKLLEKLNKLEESNIKQRTALTCEYCGETNIVKIDLNTENMFECKKCGNGNNVMIQLRTTRITDSMTTIVTGSDDERSTDLEDFNNE